MNTILKKYADLLINYCVELQPNEKLLVKSTTLAEPLIKEVYKAALKAGGNPIIDMEFEGQQRMFLEYAEGEQLEFVSPLYKTAMKHYDAYLYIRAPYNLAELANTSTDKNKIINKALAPYRKIYSERTAVRSMKRNLCQYPTHASAQNAGMSLEEYQDFIFNSCNLYADNPKAEWLKVRAYQQKIVDVLNNRNKVQYKGNGIDITFSTEGRTWINSDGQTNMPSGEVYTCPVEDSVNGVVHFTYPTVRLGQEIEDITLWVKDGEVQKWEAKRGQHLLDTVFQIPGARRFGEAAIGTNTNINRFTKNILFDEKIGGTIHMAIGQSYLQTGGKNQSSIHWDMIADMMNGGEIYADDELIYKNGKFLFL